jgi:hypothetical protein
MKVDFIFVMDNVEKDNPLLWTAYALKLFGGAVFIMSNQKPAPPFNILKPAGWGQLFSSRLWLQNPLSTLPNMVNYLSPIDDYMTNRISDLTNLFIPIDKLKPNVEARLTSIREANPALTILVDRGEQGAWLLQERWFYNIAAYPANTNSKREGAQEVFAAAYALQAINGSTPARALQWAAAAARLKLDVEDWRKLPNDRAVTAFLKHTAPPLPVQQTEWGSDLAKSWLSAEG